VRLHSFAGRPVERDLRHAACQDAGDLGAVFDRSALVIDGFARGLRGLVESGERGWPLA
jgi:hypothetical protein